MTIEIDEFLQRVSELLRLVEGGEQVVVTRAAQPVAQLSPPSGTRRGGTSVGLQRLIDAGLVIPGSGRGLDPNWRPIKISGRPTSELLIEEREDRV